MVARTRVRTHTHTYHWYVIHTLPVLLNVKCYQRLGDINLLAMTVVILLHDSGQSLFSDFDTVVGLSSNTNTNVRKALE
jgi:hypothetical protein